MSREHQSVHESLTEMTVARLDAARRIAPTIFSRLMEYWEVDPATGTFMKEVPDKEGGTATRYADPAQAALIEMAEHAAEVHHTKPSDERGRINTGEAMLVFHEVVSIGAMLGSPNQDSAAVGGDEGARLVARFAPTEDTGAGFIRTYPGPRGTT